MLSAAVIYILCIWGCIEGIRRPWVGLLVFYGFVVLEPSWNWRWAIDVDFPFQKYLAFCLFTGVLVCGIRKPRVRGATLRSLISLVAFLGLAYVSATQSINPEYSFAYLGVLWKVVLMAVLTVWLIDTPKKIWILMWVVVIGQGYSAYQINLQYFQEGFSRYAVNGWGNKGDNNVYSIFTIPIMAMSASLAVYGKTWWQQLLAGAIFVMQLHVLMLLESRGTMIGGLFLAGVFAVLVPKKPRVWKQLVVATVCGVLLAGPSVIREFSSAFESGENRDSSAESRFEVWTAGAIITAQNPALGVGPNAGRFLVPQYVPSENRSQKALHNLLFEISTGCGVPATLLYLSFFGFITWACLQGIRSGGSELPEWAAAVYLAVACGVPGYWVASMFSSGALLESSYLLVAIGGAALLTLRRQMKAAHARSQRLVSRQTTLPKAA